MPAQINTDTQPKQSDLQVKLLALYDLNRSYIDEAEKFLSTAPKASTDKFLNEGLKREDIDRLYSHIFVLEHIAKLLYEEFLTNKNGGLPKWSGNEPGHQIEANQ